LEENIPLDHLYYALTIYGEAGGENAASKRAIAWIIRNRMAKKRWGDSYQEIVVRPSQFNCWNRKDANYPRLQRPGQDNSADKTAWEESIQIIKEVHNALEKDNPIPGVCNYFSGEPNKKIPWEKNYFNLPGVPHFHFVKLD
jgi:spore germination cell wall hydrolase CwlJ-like protein